MRDKCGTPHSGKTAFLMAINTILDVRGLTKRIGSLVLMDHLTFSLPEGQKVGIVAQNGAGKSTLLNILNGEDDYDEGEIVWRRNLRVGYLHQRPSYPADLTVIEACLTHGSEEARTAIAYQQALSTGDAEEIDHLTSRMEALNAWDYETRIKQILSMLKITDFNEKIQHLSGGEVKRVALANILLTEPDLLILDEPTNHLDLDMIEWLERYLSQTTMSILMVTHDRYFLDNVCDRIMELSDHQFYTYDGNYSYYLRKRQERIDQFNARQERLQNLYRKELDWIHRSPQARGHKARYRQEAFYKLEEQAHRSIKEDTIRPEMKSTYIGNKIFEMNYISKAFGNKVILKDFYYNFSRFEKMGIVGNNGTGKSTFLKLLLGLEQPDSGKISIGQTVRFGYYSQEGLEFNQQQRVIDVVKDIAEYVDLGHGRKLSASQFLQQFLFTPDQQYNYIYKLSGGEQRRLYLCTVLMRSPNFLVLDEPTNDLDIVTLQVLEEYLRRFEGCVIIVSHDRFFMDKVVDHLLVFRGAGDVKDFPGNYTQYRNSDLYVRQHNPSSLRADASSPSNANSDAAYRRDDHTAVYSKGISASAKGGALASNGGASSAQDGTVTTKGGAVTSKGAGHKQKDRTTQKRRLTYKENQEYQLLGQDIDRLEAEKRDIEAALSSGSLSVEKITELSKRLPALNEELGLKSLRWLELSEFAEG